MGLASFNRMREQKRTSEQNTQVQPKEREVTPPIVEGAQTEGTQTKDKTYNNKKSKFVESIK